jgi:hypothetical protein
VSLKAKVSTSRKQKRVRGKTRTIVKSSVLLSGRVLENLQGVDGAKIAFLAGGKSAGTATTGSSGSFAKRLALAETVSFRVRVTVQTRETACANPLPETLIPGGCTSATIAGYRLTSSAVIAKPTPRRR